jgi:hypothetical protein
MLKIAFVNNGIQAGTSKEFTANDLQLDTKKKYIGRIFCQVNYKLEGKSKHHKKETEEKPAGYKEFSRIMVIKAKSEEKAKEKLTKAISKIEKRCHEHVKEKKIKSVDAFVTKIDKQIKKVLPDAGREVEIKVKVKA